jgi:hypothetical protein
MFDGQISLMRTDDVCAEASAAPAAKRMVNAILETCMKQNSLTKAVAFENIGTIKQQ